ncbi:hypothetical protein B7494_g3317 [Chlorociboria aeruginascens]|nr:hypothetical protein B7494_g3317 [Chlorociboria aeruginascens]
MSDPSVWDKPIAVPVETIQYADEAVLATGTQVKSLRPHGYSYWTRTAEIKTVQADGSELSFFIKVFQNDAGRGMMSGEMIAMTELHEAMPDFAPTPIAWGTYVSIPDTHFFLCSFIDMSNELPDIEEFTSKLAELHKSRISPNGKFGTSTRRYYATIPQGTLWADTWEELFTQSLKDILAFELKSQGPNQELEDLSKQVFEKVIPRLLRPLETGGNRILPRIIHGDLWDGNCAALAEGNKPIIFDGISIYAHNEYELAPWGCPRHKIGKKWREAYHRHFPPSEPKEDVDDRNLLYSIKFDAASSSLYPGNLRFRNLMIESMKTLVDKFPDGYQALE